MVLCTHFIIDTADSLHNNSSCKYGCLLNLLTSPRGLDPRPLANKDIQQTRTNTKSFFLENSGSICERWKFLCLKWVELLTILVPHKCTPWYYHTSIHCFLPPPPPPPTPSPLRLAIKLELGLSTSPDLLQFFRLECSNPLCTSNL